MKINSTGLKQKKYPSNFCTEPDSGAIKKEFPDLKNLGPYEGHSTGYIRPVEDKVFIENRGKELEGDLKSIPERIKKLKAKQKVANGLLIAGMTGIIGGALMAFTPAGTAAPLAALSAIGVGAGTGLAGGFMETGKDRAVTRWEYYEKRTELDHLRKGEVWEKASCSK